MSSPNMSTVSELTAKRAKAQSYFDRYPERKGQGPYVPKAKLVHSTSSKTIVEKGNNSSTTTSDRSKDSPKSGVKVEQTPQFNTSERKKKENVNQITDQRSRIRRETDVDPSSERQWHSRTSERAIRLQGPPQKVDENQETAPKTLKQIRGGLTTKFSDISPSPTTNLSLPSSSSGWSNHTTSRSYDTSTDPFQSYERQDEPIQRKANDRSQHTNDAPSSSRSKVADSVRTESSNDSFLKKNTLEPLMTRSVTSNFASQLAFKPKTWTKHIEMASDSTSRSSVPSIEEIIGRHTPTYTTDSESNSTLLHPDRSSPCGSRRPSTTTNTVNSYSSSEKQDKSQELNISNEADDGNLSDSSLDSVELEIKNSLRMNTPTHSRTQSGLERMMFASLSPALQASFNRRTTSERPNDQERRNRTEEDAFSENNKRFLPHPMVPSISAPALIHKKSTPSLKFSKAGSSSASKRDRLTQTDKGFLDSLPRQDKSSVESSQGSDSSSGGLNVPSIHRSKSSADLGGGGTRLGNSPFYAKRSSSTSLAVVPPLPPLPSKRIQKLQATPSKEIEEAKSIRQFVYSNRLTQLITLNRLPYTGKTVSFADVGDGKGHTVFIFMGLGAVRYLIGLYDEMASALGLRLICIDRWGIGRTDDLPSDKRGVLEWSNVVAEVADRLEIRNFSILAHSAGAPYAMATTLMQSNRLIGPVHLLAPWVSPQIESGYKWLRYVPDGVIRTAQAAEWRMQGWKLGVNSKATAVNPEEDRDSSFSSRDDYDVHENDNARTIQQTLDMNNDQSNTLIGHRSFDSSFISLNSNSGADHSNASPMGTSLSTGSASYQSPSSMKEGMAYRSNGKNGNGDFVQQGNGHKSSPSRSSLASLAEHYDVLNAWHTRTNSNELNNLPSVPPKTPSKDKISQQTRMNTSNRLTSPSPSPSPNTNANIKTSPSTITDLPTELLKASHAESGGASNDLLVILGRSSQKPWGFAYTDIDYPIRVWHGEKDERINVSSVLWMEREMRDCQVTFVKNANHSLMTNVNVVIEALESIASYSRQQKVYPI